MAALKEYAATAKPSDELVAILTQLSKEHYKNNKYVVNSNDNRVTKYDLNNLPEIIAKDLSLFAVDLINQIRKYFGTFWVNVSEDSVGFAKK